MVRIARIATASLLLILLPGLARSAEAQGAPSAFTPQPFKLSGYVQLRESWAEGTGLSASLNRARLIGAGAPLAGLSYKLVIDLRTGTTGTGKSSASLTDFFVRYQRGAWAIQGGQFKTPFAREFLISIADVELPNRALPVDQLAPKRDIGLMGEVGVGQPVTLSLGIFNGEGQNVAANADSTLLGVGRPALRLAAGIEVGGNAALFGGDSLRYGGDVSVRRGELLLRAEYLGQHREGATPEAWGWYVLAGYDVRPTVQLLARYERLDKAATDARGWTLGAGIKLKEPALRLLLAAGSRRDAPGADWQPTAITQLLLRF